MTDDKSAPPESPHPEDSAPLHAPSTWTFLSNHAHVLVCLARDPEMRVREIANRVGITERGVQRIMGELKEAGVIDSTRNGRRNSYAIHHDVPLRHPLEGNSTVGELLRAMTKNL